MKCKELGATVIDDMDIEASAVSADSALKQIARLKPSKAKSLRGTLIVGNELITSGPRYNTMELVLRGKAAGSSVNYPWNRSEIVKLQDVQLGDVGQNVNCLCRKTLATQVPPKRYHMVSRYQDTKATRS